MTASFRSYALDDTNGVTFSAQSELPSIEGKRSPLLGDGHVFERTSRSGRTVKLSGKVKGDNETQFHERVRALLQVLQNPTQGPLVLDTFELPCVPRLKGLNYVGPIDVALVADWSCDFESPEPFWEETPSLLASKTLTNNGVSEESFTITYDADLAPTWPKFQIESLKASLVTGYEVTIRNDATGAEFRLLDFDLGQNDILIADPYTEQVYIATNATGNAVAPRRVDGVFWPLEAASITCVVKHNQIGLSPNFRVSSECRKWHYGYRT